MINYNLIGYGVFISCIVFIVKVVGDSCYRNGNIFVTALIPEHTALGEQVNRVLLVGYYLVNIGYAAMTIIGWESLVTLSQLIEVVAFKISLIVFILSVLHYFNIVLLTTSIQKLIKTP